ncbi:hypothetical protein RAB80_018270 [Fusarium oxysporum f. sp. vasinfectum]|uniref:Uncharacterized protein n=1 Tax=Fusarium oxysporum f. sp. vasinfectum 25433 TaxID=1089449 RepID=X0KKD9_FUSOX|nr:hypothetical protein FOTG_17566 [Fusarium oxysporum f. sp. vasinfectum 25433]KAK2666170.1 hypothetical protein RAB80_018270 [Fusarium oxysporum f. sp. vasinfectum]KAK2922344.1 hypothetical protein FoTM2_017700 [Fusarium oxysporum f. sp. vasinfectum]
MDQEISWFLLDDSTDEYQRKVNAANALLKIRKHVDQNKLTLKTFTKRQFSQRKQKDRFSDNVQKLVGESEESQVFLPLLKNSASNSDDSINQLLLALYTFTDADFELIKQHGLTEIVSALLRKTCDCTVFPDIRSEFIRIIKNVCGDEETNTGPTNKALLLGLLKDMETHHEDTFQPFFLTSEALHAPRMDVHPDLITKTVAYQLVGARSDRLIQVLRHSAMLQAITVSYQWNFERRQEKVSPASEMRTDAIVAMIPKDNKQDISFVLRVGYRAGWEIVEHLDLRSSQEPMTK